MKIIIDQNFQIYGNCNKLIKVESLRKKKGPNSPYIRKAPFITSHVKKKREEITTKWSTKKRRENTQVENSGQPHNVTQTLFST